MYDSPALYGDVWVARRRAIVEATDHIGVATGVAVGFLRHVMVTASAIATIEELAPGRLTFAVGTGFTGARAMGQKAMKWADLATYVTQLRGLLHGDAVEVDGARCRMIHSPGYAPPRPIDVPLLLAPMGPKGFAYAREVADGVIVAFPPGSDEWDPCALLCSGTVLEPGEDHTSPRVLDALESVVCNPGARPLGVLPRDGHGDTWRRRLVGRSRRELRRGATTPGSSTRAT